MKTALITGATAGIGQATARTLAANGWRVIGTGRRQERIDALGQELGADRFLGLVFDVRDAEARNAALDGLPDDWSDIDLLVNNAGLAAGLDAAQEADLADWHTMVDTNVVALLGLTRRLLPGLIERKGAIVNIGSVAGSYIYPGGAVYAGSKAFVNHFTLALRADLHGTGVRATSIEPGMVETEFTTVRTGSQDKSDEFYAGAHPMTAEDIAETIRWVAELPAHLNVNRLEIMPVTQDFAGFRVARDS
ncbi:SDR family NAD(P)-dependent oxidoreductase [Citromicrobium bathyomarinum]|uniref:SDR family NAD(P)-dependent oxidoreductase n=1 Tax=Citromicrobium bathyomarinum TaxID=72174 RepID=UPI003159AC59